MAPAEDTSDIRVFVHWHEQTIFAGEEIKCTITFKNIAQASDQQRTPTRPPPSDRHRLTSSLQSRAKANNSLSGPPAATTGRGHRRSALSLSAPPASSRRGSGSIQWPSGGPGGEGRPKHAHKRSVSIVSIGSANTVDDHGPRHEGPPGSARTARPSRAHNRASSLQILPRGPLSPNAGPQSAPFFSRQMTSPSTFNASYPPDRFGGMRNGSAARSPLSPSGSARSPRASPNPMPEFRFPAAPPPPETTDGEETPSRPLDDGFLSPRSEHNHQSSRLKDGSLGHGDRPLPAARILSSTSMQSGTPRSSGEFYSVSNHSSETLASEYVTHPPRTQARSSNLRRSLNKLPYHQRAPETLMMGYAQIQGSFVLDGSLVSLSPFEQVKKKAVVGGRGGGVVGLEPTRQRETGLLKSFGWGNISNSLGDFLGGGELSTIREMRGAANSKSIPLLNTPQSILFVDLQLSPGQSRTFEYTFKLPKGLPPSHKGKAVKISYSLVIGTQRPGGAKEQQVRSVETPFRVLGSVNSAGEILGHDLMNPYILLRDEAQVNSVGKEASLAPKAHKAKASRAPATLNDFLNYVDELVTRPRNENGGQLLSPSMQVNSRRASAITEETSSKDAIHFAIMRSNMAMEGQQSPNRFEIARNGMRVGTVMLTRPSYRLGEVVTMVIDLSETDIPCYAVHMTLETSEKVDPSLAVRSESSIHRVTRKVYTTSSDTTLYSRRVVFTPTIPISGTPEFVTSGVNFEWKVRVEFVVPSSQMESQVDDPSEAENTSQPQEHPLLEQISQHERGGLVLAAVENLSCESFDVLVPLRVYGAVGAGLERLERDEASQEGLVV